MNSLDVSDNAAGPQGGIHLAYALMENEFILNVVSVCVPSERCK